MIALLPAEDPAYIHEAAKRGVFAYIVDTTPEELQSAIDITLQRFAEYHGLQGSVRSPGGDRAGEGDPHGPPRDRRRQGVRDAAQPLPAQRSQALDVAAAVVDSHLLLVPQQAHELNGTPTEFAAVVVSDVPAEEIDLPR